MTAVEALRAARGSGVEVTLDGDNLALEANEPPPQSVLEVLSCNKAKIVALLRSGRDGWSAQDWLAYFDERAGIAEFDGSLPRAEAEARAFACCVAEWLNRHPTHSPPNRCLGCRGGMRIMIRCCPSVPKRPAMFGCTVIAGVRGTTAERHKPLPS